MKWFYRCWLESGRAHSSAPELTCCEWLHCYQGQAGLAEQLSRWGKLTSGAQSMLWKNQKKPVLVQKEYHLQFLRSILLWIKENKWGLCLVLFNFCAAQLQFGHLMAAIKFWDKNFVFVTPMYSFNQHFQVTAECKYQTSMIFYSFSNSLLFTVEC